MGVGVLIMGESGTGKSTSIRNLDPDSTYILNVLDKPMPFKGGKNRFQNYFATDNWETIVKCIRHVSEKKPEIKVLVIDDITYIMSNEYMRRVNEKGYQKFSEIAYHFWIITEEIRQSRDDLIVIITGHTQVDNDGIVKFKTLGKLLDDKIKVEGMFTSVLYSVIVDSQYKFQTQGNSQCVAKSPIGMFDDFLIDNDMAFVVNKIQEYYK